MRRRALAAALATAFVVLAGCGKSPAPEPQAETTPAVTAAPAERLKLAAEKVTSAPYKFTLRSSGPINLDHKGHVDPSEKTATFTFGRFVKKTLARTSGEVLVIGDESWLKVTEPASAPDSWLLVSVDDMSPDSEFRHLLSDPAGLDRLIGAVVDVSAPDDMNFEGIVDATQVPGVAALAQQLGEPTIAAKLLDTDL